MDNTSLSNLLISVGSIFVIVVCVLLATAIRSVEEHERFVVFRSGNYLGVRGPGFVFLLPYIDRYVSVDLREQICEITVETTTKEGTPVSVDITFTYKITNPYTAVVKKAEKTVVEVVLKESDAAVHYLPLMEVLTPSRLHQELNDRRQMMSHQIGAEIASIEVRQAREVSKI